MVVIKEKYICCDNRYESLRLNVLNLRIDGSVFIFCFFLGKCLFRNDFNFKI